MKMIDGDNVKIATESSGTPVRGTIVLVMGATASMIWWPSSLIEQLESGGFRVIRYDHRDTGQSTTGAPGHIGYDVDNLANDLIAVLDAYEVESVHLVGMSLGGLLAQIVALRLPTRVQSLTLIAAEPLGMEYEGAGLPAGFMAHFGKMADLDWNSREAVVDFMLGIARLSGGCSPQFDAESAKDRIRREIDHARNMQSAFNHSMIAGELEPALQASNLTQPTLIIHGTEDPLISVNAARRSESSIAGSNLMLLEGRGHELLAQDGPLIARAILNHIH